MVTHKIDVIARGNPCHTMTLPWPPVAIHGTLWHGHGHPLQLKSTHGTVMVILSHHKAMLYPSMVIHETAMTARGNPWHTMAPPHQLMALPWHCHGTAMVAHSNAMVVHGLPWSPMELP